MEAKNNTPATKKPVKHLDHVVIRFAGDSGDGMQLTGTQFTMSAALLGNDVFTFPNYPAEIRAPQGSLYGVSGYQVQIGSHEVDTPGDKLDLLVAMNPAALKKNLPDLKKGGMIIVDTDAFTNANLQKAHYESNPLEDGSLKDYTVVEVPMTSLTREALKDIPIDSKSKTRSKNMFALGMVYWLYGKDPKYTEAFLRKKFKNKPDIVEANIKALKTGWNYAETLELMPVSYIVDEAEHHEGKYKIINGNMATAWGLIAAAEKAGLQLFLGSYPITPATDILQELSKYRQLDVIAFQAEDEIAGVTSAIGASFAGKLAATTTSGPGLALKGEAIGLAVMLEIPLIIIDVQRGGPSTGLPTKTEQADLMQALYGRNGESPVIVIAAKSPSDAFYRAFEAAKLTLEHMTPVILLTDGYIGNGSEPWKVMKLEDLPDIHPPLVKKTLENWHPYDRDPETLARKWVIPGTPGMEHVIGGLEKDKESGAISYEPENHEYMVKIREEKVQRVKNYIPEMKAEFDQEGDLLIIGWGGTYGALKNAAKVLRDKGHKVGLAHFTHIKPLPKGTAEVFSKYKKLVVAELNLGQFANYLRMNLPQFRYEQVNKIQGLPFYESELTEAFEKIIKA